MNVEREEEIDVKRRESWVGGWVFLFVFLVKSVCWVFFLFGVDVWKVLSFGRICVWSFFLFLKCFWGSCSFGGGGMIIFVLILWMFLIRDFMFKVMVVRVNIDLVRGILIERFFDFWVVNKYKLFFVIWVFGFLIVFGLFLLFWICIIFCYGYVGCLVFGNLRFRFLMLNWGRGVLCICVVCGFLGEKGVELNIFDLVLVGWGEVGLLGLIFLGIVFCFLVLLKKNGCVDLDDVGVVVFGVVGYVFFVLDVCGGLDLIVGCVGVVDSIELMYVLIWVWVFMFVLYLMYIIIVFGFLLCFLGVCFLFVVIVFCIVGVVLGIGGGLIVLVLGLKSKSFLGFGVVGFGVEGFVEVVVLEVLLLFGCVVDEFLCLFISFGVFVGYGLFCLILVKRLVMILVLEIFVCLFVFCFCGFLVFSVLLLFILCFFLLLFLRVWFIVVLFFVLLLFFVVIGVDIGEDLVVLFLRVCGVIWFGVKKGCRGWWVGVVIMIIGDVVLVMVWIFEFFMVS